MGFFTKPRPKPEVKTVYQFYYASWDGSKFTFTSSTTDYKPHSATIVADDTCVVTYRNDGVTELRPATGVDRIRKAIDKAGGLSGGQVQGYA